MSARHLGPALVAGGLFLAGIAGFTVYARAVERRSVHAFAPAWFHQKSLGNALQREAFRQTDLLPVFGTSELTSGGSYNADRVFDDYPTGFDMFRVGWPGYTPLVTTAMQIAADCPEVCGEKLVISMSPLLFWRPSGEDLARYYAGNFSRLQANELAFSTCLSRPVKQRLARRLLVYPAPLAADPVLKLVLELLASSSAPSRVAYAALYPLGLIRLAALRLEDHWETLAWIRAQGTPRPPKPRRPQAVHWPEVIAHATAIYEATSGKNPLGVDDDWWSKNGAGILKQRGRHPDAEVGKKLRKSPEWEDLDLLLDVLDELGVRPLLMAVPMKGAYYDLIGVSYAVRKQFFYDRLAEIAAAHHVALACFADHDGDSRFTADTGDHPSPRGWAFYDQTMDAFVHDALR